MVIVVFFTEIELLAHGIQLAVAKVVQAALYLKTIFVKPVHTVKATIQMA
tara:strand:- start:883 stop:1032 length:150 start_codon:yes stop_codon:yes gene_type:complete